MKLLERFLGFAGLLLAPVLAGADPPAESAGLLRLSVDRRAVQQLDAAADQFANQEFTRAIPALEGLWFLSGSQLAARDSAWATFRHRIRELIRQLPDSDQQRFWKRIEAGSVGGQKTRLADLPTRSGLRALASLGAEFRDRNESQLAAAAFAVAAIHPAATAEDARLFQVLQLESQAEFAGPGVITEWLSAQDDRELSRSLTIQGEPITVERWLNDRAVRLANVGWPQRGRHDRPASTPIWKKATFASEEFLEDLKQSLSELRSHGISRLPTAVPEIVGSRIVTRTPMGLTCLSAESGTELWSIPDQTAGNLLTTREQRRGWQPRLFAQLMFPVVERLQVNTLHGAISHDSQCIYHVVPLSAPSPSNPSPGLRYGLEVLDAATGQVLGKLGESKSAEDEWNRSLKQAFPALTFGGTEDFSVCGPPAVLGSHLYFLATLSSELVFLAVHQETRRVAWGIEVGHLPPHFGRLTSRAYTGCRPIWTGKLLITPTASGVIAAFDPILQQAQWYAPIPVDAPFHSLVRGEASATSASDLALRTWREAVILPAGDRLVSISPESQAVHCLETATGRLICSIPRENGLTLSGVSHDRLYVLEPAAIRSHDLTTGAMQWRTVIGEICGHGALIGNRIVQPLAEGSVAVIDLQSGRRLPGTIHADMTLGNLRPVDDGWLSVDEFQISRFRDLTSPRSDEPPERLFADLTAQQENLEAGDFAAVKKFALGRSDESARELLRRADLAELRFAPKQGPEIRERLLSLSKTSVDRGEALLALGQASLATSALTTAMKDGLDGLPLELTGEVEIREDAVRRVRWDRAFLGLVLEAYRTSQDDQRAWCQELIDRQRTAAEESSDPFAPQQFCQRMRMFPGVRRRMSREPESVFLGLGSLAREMLLREAIDSHDEVARIDALFRLRQEWRETGFRQEAVDIEQDLLRDIPGAITAQGLTVTQRLAAEHAEMDRLLRREYGGPIDGWPRTKPKFSTEAEEDVDESHRTIIPINSQGGTLWERLEAGIDRYGRQLQFSGAGQNGPWSVEIPKSSAGVHPYTYRGWAIGPLLIVRIGTLLAAVSPFDDQGNPQAKVLWSRDLLETTRLLPEQLAVERVPAPWKQVEDEFRLVDGFHRDLGRIGPLRAGYLCFQQQGKLVAVEPLTGRMLWERWDVAPGTIPLGDNDQVLLWRPDEEELEVLSAGDGRTIGRRTCEVSPREVWHVSGGTVWTGQVNEGLVVACRDLIADRLTWQTRFPPESQPLRLDHRTGGVIDPGGLLYLFDLHTGAPLGEPLTIDVPQPLERVTVHRDESRWYLGLSGSMERVFDWQSTQPFLGYRRPMMRGPLYAIDRATRQIVWRSDLTGEPWLLDQPPAAPVLVQAFKRPPLVPGQGIGEGVLRVLDKRTGQELLTHRDLNLTPYVAVDVDPDLKRVSLKTERLSLRLDYDVTAGE
ncbi:MAG: PQQ-binding-like beta-propeller repeat protein [Planctomycetaceae bacterium]